DAGCGGRPAGCRTSQGDHVKTLAALFAVAAFLSAQQPVQPHAGYVYPAGGQRGRIVDVRVGGQYLNGAGKAHISGRGVEVSRVEYERPPTGAEAQKLRDEMQE